MNDPKEPLHILSQLAHEYGQKYEELEEICRSAQPGTVARQLKIRGELTTERFRTAQMSLIGMLSSATDKEQEKALQAVTALSRCFDEMRILFQVLMEYTSKSNEEENQPI